MMNIFRILQLSVLLILLSGCSFRGLDFSAVQRSDELRNISVPVDYSLAANWVVCETTSDFEADIFIAYPTIVSHKDHAFMDWSDQRSCERAYRYIPVMAGAFTGVGRIFVPFYRQTEYRRAIKAVKENNMVLETIAPGIEDLRNAFRFYLKHFNKNRPFILFGHSQGAMALLEVMRSELKDEQIRKHLVAAYLIGYPKMPKDFAPDNHLRLAKGSFDTGVIITWNSVAEKGEEDTFTGGNYYCINPLNWRTDDLAASEKYSRGAVFWNKDGSFTEAIPNFCTAQIDMERGALVVRPAEEYRDHPFFDDAKGSLHAADIFLFYRNITENAKLRIKAFFKR